MSAGPRFSGKILAAEKPLPLWVLYPLFFVLIYVSHWKLLRLPYFWDEAGYYIPAALDFFRHGQLVPTSTVTNAHPPLPSVLLAGWWHLSGFATIGTRTLVCMVAAAALLGVFRLARGMAGTAVAAAVTGLTAMYPVWFAQSTLAHADIFAATFTLWGLAFYFERRWAGVAGMFALAALSKETAIVTAVVLGLWELVLAATEKDWSRWRAVTALFFAVLPLALWYGYHWRHTGFVFGNPEFLRYNATANLSVGRVLTSLWHRVTHLTLHMNLYVATVATVAVALMPKLTGRAGLKRAQVLAIAVVIAGNALAFSVLGGALLTRYLLPMYPLVLLVCVTLWRTRTTRWGWLAGLTAAGFLLGLWVNPPYGFAPEDNLTYVDMVQLHQQAIAVIAAKYPEATVLTAWPGVAELRYPDLGYTRRAVTATAIDNFSFEEIQKAAAMPGEFDTAFVFSTKWTPPAGRLDLGAGNVGTNTKFYDFHRDLGPREIAGLLHGQVIWSREQRGEWAAVLRFPRAVEARANALRVREWLVRSL